MDVLPVSVVIPAYRRAAMVERALQSVLAQSRQPAEIVVVDDASGDDTGPRAAELGARVITHDANLGEGAARNTGLAAAVHDWVALLDSDDEWLPFHLATLWPARNGHVIVGTAALATGERRVYGWAGRRPCVLRGPVDVATPENKLVPSAVMLRRQPALEIGGFRRGMPRAADLELWIRLLALGTGIAVPRVTALYHMHAGQVTTDREQMWTAHRQVVDTISDADARLSVRRRHEGVVAWDTARAALADGADAVPTLVELTRGLCPPRRLLGVVGLLASRFRSRRLAARLSVRAEPTVALLPGARATAPAEALDLRDRNLVRAMVTLARAPTSRAVVGGRVVAVLVRLLGIEPVSDSSPL